MSDGSMTDVADVDVMRDGRKATIAPAGDIVASMAGTLKPRLKNMVHDGVDTLVFDLARTTMVDSVGIGLIVAAHNSVQKSGGSISVIHASKDLLDLFKALRLDQHFSVTG
jgi:anti-anti-sigma factor